MVGQSGAPPVRAASRVNATTVLRYTADSSSSMLDQLTIPSFSGGERRASTSRTSPSTKAIRLLLSPRLSGVTVAVKPRAVARHPLGARRLARAGERKRRRAARTRPVGRDRRRAPSRELAQRSLA
jgi:hypothetical protein